MSGTAGNPCLSAPTARSSPVASSRLPRTTGRISRTGIVRQDAPRATTLLPCRSAARATRPAFAVSSRPRRDPDRAAGPARVLCSLPPDDPGFVWADSGARFHGILGSFSKIRGWGRPFWVRFRAAGAGRAAGTTDRSAAVGLFASIARRGHTRCRAIGWGQRCVGPSVTAIRTETVPNPIARLRQYHQPNCQRSIVVERGTREGNRK